MGLQHGRAQTTLLISKILNSHAGISPFTLAIDSMEQCAKYLLRDYMQRASERNIEIIYISFETLRKPALCKYFFRAYDSPFAEIKKRVLALMTGEGPRQLLVIDSLHSLLYHSGASIVDTLFSMIRPNVTLFAVLHGDQPISKVSTLPHSPDLMTLLRYIATTVLTLCSMLQMLNEQHARLRSVSVRPTGLRDAEEGILQSLGSNDATYVVDMEHRRKSGRSIRALFAMQTRKTAKGEQSKSGYSDGDVVLLDEHPAMRAVVSDQKGLQSAVQEENGTDDSTFNLQLTEKQKEAREGIVLPYFDAQNQEKGVGAGGRILYDMGEEDDFDDEEDEI